MEDMNETTKFLCASIQGAKMGYVQSDEISIWLTDYDDIKTDAWFDYNLQKMCSIAASLATAKFNQLRMARKCWDGNDVDGYLDNDDINKFNLATFDARIFILPSIDEVVNYFIWRQQDATRNSISMAAQSLYSHKELNGKSSDDKQEMMFQKGVNWNDYPTRFKRGAAIYKIETKTLAKDFKFKNDHKTHIIEENQFIVRKEWIINRETPIFSQDKEFIESIIQNLD
jgi:tRNA(His) 5'-end guanylyltransferase